MVADQDPPLPRTIWAEQHVEEFLTLPLVSEFVFGSPQTVDSGTQREVADFLLTWGDVGILISQKCQEDPLGRSRSATETWARKKSRKAVWQCVAVTWRAARRQGSAIVV